MTDSILSLQDLNLLIKKRLQESFRDTYWIQAEVSECKEHYSGHCYLDLIQKKEGKDTICARSRATVWASVWSELSLIFERQTGSRLRSGHNILIEVSVEFHEVYGMNLIVRSIDPAYTLGDQAARRMEILKKLELEGVIDQNRELEIPALPLKVAVVSSPQAAGLQDFNNQLCNNGYGFVFYTSLFPAIMQGENAADSVIDALDRVIECGVDFDVVVVIRGGGAVADMSCFDNYDLCYYCTQFPVPVLTGLGHDKDFSVLDRVANVTVKTPTAAAEYLIDMVLRQSFRIESCFDSLTKHTSAILEKNKLKLMTYPGKLSLLVKDSLDKEKLLNERRTAFLERLTGQNLLREKQRLEMIVLNLLLKKDALINKNKHKLELLERLINSNSPQKILEKGFTMTSYNNRIVKSFKDVRSGNILKTTFKDGSVESVVVEEKK